MVLLALLLERFDHWHLLPGSTGYLIFLFFPFVIAWDRVGALLLLIVAVCEFSFIQYGPHEGKMRMRSAIVVGTCLITYALIRASVYFNFH